MPELPFRRSELILDLTELVLRVKDIDIVIHSTVI